MSEQVRDMFSDISAEYDLLNDVLSFGRHRCWKNKFVKNIKLPNDGKHLDVATGTGDIAELVVKKYGMKTEIIGVDFSESMIIKARFRKNSKYVNLDFQTGDATDLKYPDNYFDSVSISFGIRNIPSLVKAIEEMGRVIKPGGLLAIMEFGTPSQPFNIIYKFYSKYLIPNIGKIMTGNDFAYKYLPETIKKFPYGEEFKKIVISTNIFSDIKVSKMDFGAVFAYYCTKK
ncbi:MAG: bifunctional demethylmenaquinone methyltransferase/2-methoxy-6-polyprenyl-1,4-benzoquinol methylase UbiE [Candidatus Kapabacteria bacterium]|nr:bifunctional demethylmenaquinone methyltransferase/2-methoxy-6-polyprenyl-1,4-benzoquinol methylase UbiE [Ignavibacteriota bacterium]MCW5883383.1 bifunctional demethylmenaquinone methyltransferase/2-methoxy-6-polyprenyl-1,4-benzoquinol methylase UbiE [Candidatus Kapabacteria bacterium]